MFSLAFAASRNPLTLGVPIWGRREHFEVISKFWIQRDVRPLDPTLPLAYSSIFNTTVHLASEQIGSKHLLPLTLHSPPQWFDTPTHNEFTQLSSMGSAIFAKSDFLPYFCNPELQVHTTRSLFLSNHENKKAFKEMGCLPIPPTTHSKQLEDSSREGKINDKDLLIFTPVFEYKTHLLKLPRLHNTVQFHLSIHPLIPNFIEPKKEADWHKIENNRGAPTLQPSSLLSGYLFNNALATTSATPFIILAIDLCDISSINIAVWGYHALLYLYNHASAPFPDPSTTVVVMIFNSMALDTLIVTENQVHSWFENFPFPTQFLSYPILYPLPQITTMQQTPAANPPTSVNPVNSPPDTSPPSPLPRSELEQTNIDFIQQLDTLLIQKVQHRYLNKIITIKNHQTLTALGEFKSPPIQALPCPVQSAIRYPLNQNIGEVYQTAKFGELDPNLQTLDISAPGALTGPMLRPLKKKIKIAPNNAGAVPNFERAVHIPNNMSHWCIFDKFHTLSSSKNQNLLSGIESSGVQDNLLVQLANKGTIKDNMKPSTRPSTQSNQVCDFNSRETFHSCVQLSIKLSALTVESIWKPKSAITTEELSYPQDLINAIQIDSFDLIVLPMQFAGDIPSQTDPQQQQQQQHITTLDNTVHLVKQIPNYTTINTDLEVDSAEFTENDSLHIDHYPTPSLVPVLQYEYLARIGQDEIKGMGNEDSQEQQQDTAHSQQASNPPTVSSSPSIPTTIYQTVEVPNRFYAMSCLDENARKFLELEKPTLCASHHELSTIFTQFSQHSVEKCSALTQTAITPMSSNPHHFNIFFEPHLIEHPSVEPVALSTQNLMSLSVVNASTLHIQICAILHFRHLIFSKPPGLFKKIFSFKPLPTFDFRSSTYSLKPQTRDAQFHDKTPPQLSHPSTHSDTIVTVHRCTVDLPTVKNHHKFDHTLVQAQLESMFRDHNNNKEAIDTKPKPTTSSTEITAYKEVCWYEPAKFNEIQDFYSNLQSLRGKAVNRSLTPYFVLIIDDIGTDDFVWDATRLHAKLHPDVHSDIQTAETKTQHAVSTPPTTFSKEATLINSFLSAIIPLSLGNFGPDVPLHYSFTKKADLKATLVKCIQLALGMRMEHYESFESVKHWDQ